MKNVLVVFLLATTVVACQKGEDKPAAAAAAAAIQKTQQAGAMEQGSTNGIVGTVAEAIDAADYTYLRITTPSGEHWAAVPHTDVKVGQIVAVEIQMEMENFKSTSLKRTFPKVLFGTVGGPGSEGAAAATGMPVPPAQAAPALDDAKAHMKGGAADLGPISVAKAEGADGRTIAELWAGRTSLKDKPVTVQAKVVKFLPSIMGRNWVHLRDGSGSAEKGDNDVTVTTDQTVAVGDVVLVTGTVRADKDFGAGYAYPVMIEDAKIQK